ncbi:MAG TPA: ABC transporter permease [Actinomycetes bacterium]|nr:ABC transporter permease [Actinomycetes bacterium]
MSVTQAPPAEPGPGPEAAGRPRATDWRAAARDLLDTLVPVAIALLTAAVIGALVILAVRRSVSDLGDVASAMWEYGLLNRDSFAYIFARATPFIFAGIATAIAFRAGLFNIGVEGQYAVGAITAAIAGYSIQAPTVIHLPLTLLAGILGGMAWAAIPGILKAWRGANEVISTIMMNYVANGLVLYLLAGPLRDTPPGVQQQRTAPVEATARVGRMNDFFNSLGFNFRASAPLTWFFALALVSAVIYGLVLRRTRFGYDIRVLGANPRAAEPSGIPPNRTFLLAMLVSGGVAGLVGLQDTLGIDGFAKLDYVRGYGFTGIAVALLGRNSGVGIVGAALLFSYLDRAASGIGLRTEVPKELVTILQGVIILTIVIAFEIARRAAERRRLKEVHERA